MDEPWVWAIIVLVALVLFGSKRLPDAARGMGRSLRIFKAETKGLLTDDEQPQPQPPAQLPAGYQQPAQPAYQQPAQPAYQQPTVQQPAYQPPAAPAQPSAPAAPAAGAPPVQPPPAAESQQQS
jgi:sec-independent protein translocase protein TatA